MQLFNSQKSVLKLSDGLDFQGFSFGYTGEVIFSTSVFGCPENLSDPAYEGKILCLSYPIIGTYGAPSEIVTDGISDTYQSVKPHIRGLIVLDYSSDFSHWGSNKSLDAWLKEYKIPGIYGIDTRRLSKHLRDNGTMLGQIVPDGFKENPAVANPELENLVAKVSCTEPCMYGKGGKKVALIDCGVCNSTLRMLLAHNLEITKVPWNYDGDLGGYDGIVISSGPGNPALCKETIATVKKALEGKKPVWGIALGANIVELAAGAKVKRMKFGHHTANQPVRLAGSDECLITSQNQNYTVDEGSLGKDWKPYYVNLNDATLDGVKHVTKPFFATEFEAEQVVKEFVKAL